MGTFPVNSQPFSNMAAVVIPNILLLLLLQGSLALPANNTDDRIFGWLNKETTTPTTTTKQSGIFDGISDFIFGTTTLAPTTEADSSLINSLLELIGLSDSDAATTAAPGGPFDAILNLLPGQGTPSPPSIGVISSLIGVLTGASTSLPIPDIANLLGISMTPVPNPMTNPIGFLPHPMVTPVISAAVTMNLPALIIAKASLAGSIVLQKLLGL